MKEHPPVIVWLRQNDFRLHDNPALHAACSSGKSVLVVYIHDHHYRGPSKLGSASAVWLEKTIDKFSAILKESGFLWSLRQGTPLDELQKIINETKASRIYWNRRYEPDLINIDKEIKEQLKIQNVTVESFPGNVLIEPFTFFNKSSKPYQVFTQFFKSLFPLLREKNAEATFTKPASPSSLSFDTLDISDLELTPKHLSWPEEVISYWRPGEENARDILTHFLREGLSSYATSRNIPSLIGTSTLSPYLHFGEISVRHVWNQVLRQGSIIPDTLLSDADHRGQFLKELAWREFNIHLLYHFPQSITSPLRYEFEKFPFRQDASELVAWQKGVTGIPIIDAGMRQLWQTGWLHNRVRMIVGSFLVKHLLHSWKEGAQWFHETLFDADLASNTMNWQWVSGCGADAAPYFRIFNPVLQGEKFDPDGSYVRKFVPELSRVPDKFIHKPWDASQKDLLSWGIELGENYPQPLIELDLGRKRALHAFSTIVSKKESSGE